MLKKIYWETEDGQVIKLEGIGSEISKWIDDLNAFGDEAIPEQFRVDVQNTSSCRHIQFVKPDEELLAPHRLALNEQFLIRPAWEEGGEQHDVAKMTHGNATGALARADNDYATGGDDGDHPPLLRPSWD